MSRARRFPWIAALAVGLVAGCYGSLIREAPDGGGACPAGQRLCSGACVDTRVDDQHCGLCGNPCSAGLGCAASACLALSCSDATCGPDQVCTFEGCRQRSCVDVKCPFGETCYDGTCRIEACGTVECSPNSICLDGGCTDVTCQGVLCPTGRACLGGLCARCTSGVTCRSNPNARCDHGLTACDGEASRCVDGAPVEPGTSCGSGLVCDADAGCVPCSAGSACSTNPTACVPGKLDCSAGQPVCVDGTGASPVGILCDGGVCGATGSCGPCGAVECPTGLACVLGTCRAPTAGCGPLKVRNPTAPSGEYLIAPGGTPVWAWCDLSDAGVALCQEGTAKPYAVVTREGSQLEVAYVAQLDHGANACTLWKIRSVDGGFPLAALVSNPKDACQALGFTLPSDAGVPCCYGTVASAGTGCPSVSSCGFSPATPSFRFGDQCSTCSVGNGASSQYVLQGSITTGLLLSNASGSSFLRCPLR